MKTSRMFAAVLSAWLAATGLVLAAGAENFGADGGIVDTAFVEAAIKRGAIVWDTRGEPEYRAGHIPGAVSVGQVLALRGPDNENIALDRLVKILGDAGIDPSKEIVLYGPRAGTGGYFAKVNLEVLGAKNVRVYHGGWQDWTAAGKPVATEPTKLPPVMLKSAFTPGIVIMTKDIVDNIGKPGVQILDARTIEEYTGKEIRASRGGHVPGAINIPYEMNLVGDRADGALKTRAALELLYAKLDRNKETIVYCQSSVRASETAIVLRDLGFTNVKVYYSSWMGYGNNPNTPVEGETKR